jgi:RING finger protein 121
MLEEKHRGHEMMHLEMILIFFGSIFLAQFLLVFWKIKHKKSYQLITLFGLWIMPAIISISAFYVRMLFVWSVFSAVTGFFVYKSTRRSITGSTPRLVYRWFLAVHQITTVVGIVGYIVMILVFSGLVLVFGLSVDGTMEVALMLMFYGIYFGLLGRDCAEMCVDVMAASMKHTSSKGAFPDTTLASSICAVCEGEIPSNVDRASSERAYKLNCGHMCVHFLDCIC